MGDQRGEAKASGNIATTLKSLCRYEEALICAVRQLELFRSLGDDVRMARDPLIKTILHLECAFAFLKTRETSILTTITKRFFFIPWQPAGISRALYNTASIVHAKAKTYAARHPDALEMPEGVKRDLNLAADYYLLVQRALYFPVISNFCKEMCHSSINYTNWKSSVSSKGKHVLMF